MKTSFSFSLLTFLTIGTCAYAQTKPADSVVIRVGESSKVIFAIHDKADLETLKHYDFQALMSDMIVKLEKQDTTQLSKSSQEYLRDTVKTDSIRKEVVDNNMDTDADDNDVHTWRNHRSHHARRTTQSWNFDIGTNNFLTSDGKFPDQTNAPYTVKPFGSWYVGINSIQRTRIARKVFLEWGVGVSWYNFKFQDEQMAITKDNNGLTFADDARDYKFLKSKLTASYINASFVPVIDFGGNSYKPSFLEDRQSNSFRIGLGPYAGYRMGSYTKQTYTNDGEKHREHNHDNFYLNNFRYGVRLQVGFRDVDLFFNYDLNTLFADNKAPKLNAFSFGVTF